MREEVRDRAKQYQGVCVGGGHSEHSEGPRVGGWWVGLE